MSKPCVSGIGSEIFSIMLFPRRRLFATGSPVGVSKTTCPMTELAGRSAGG